MGGKTLNMSKLWRRCPCSPVGGVVLVRKMLFFFTCAACTLVPTHTYVYVHNTSLCQTDWQALGKHCNVSRVSSPGSLFQKLYCCLFITHKANVKLPPLQAWQAMRCIFCRVVFWHSLCRVKPTTWRSC